MRDALPCISPWAKSTAATTAVLIVFLATAGVARYGSLSNALAYVAGERLLVDAMSKSFGVVAAGSEQSIYFSLMNQTDHPVTIVGSRSSCSCTVAEGLPMTIRAGSTQPVRILLKTSRLAGDFSEIVRLYSDESQRPEFALRVRGHVEAPVLDSKPRQEAGD